MEEALRALREKYVEMRAMRLSDEADPRARMRALAERFPGALREIDELPIETIEARIAELERAERAPAWARYLVEYHAWMRAALGIRRAAGKDRDRARARAWIADARRRGDPSERELEGAIDDLLRPPSGRLSRWVLARIAAREGLSVEAVEAEAFPRSPRRATRIA